MNYFVNPTVSQTDTKKPQKGWIRLKSHNRKALSEVQKLYGVDLEQEVTHAVEENGFVLLPVEMPVLIGEHFRSVRFLMALSSDVLITLEPESGIAPIDDVEARVKLSSEEISSKDMVLMLIETLIDTTHETVNHISLALDSLAQEALATSGGFDLKGRQVGVADIADTAIGLGEAEELIAHTVEGQLMLARAVRWVRRTMKADYTDTSIILSDIQGSRRHAQFQHAKVRNVQQSLMTTLDLKQNQIIKIFTIVTAVFTPPTLIAAYYGQNFAYMPELGFAWGEWSVMAATAFFALVPMLYIKKKGWLR